MMFIFCGLFVLGKVIEKSVPFKKNHRCLGRKGVFYLAAGIQPSQTLRRAHTM